MITKVIQMLLPEKLTLEALSRFFYLFTPIIIRCLRSNDFERIMGYRQGVGMNVMRQ